MARALVIPEKDSVNTRLVVVSNRLPGIATSAQEARSAPVGGLVSALGSALHERPASWFGWSGHTGSPKRSARVDDGGPVRLIGVDLTEREIDLYYNRFCNATLWPLLHGFSSKTSIDREAYVVYRQTSQRLARRLFPYLSDGDVVWVHDYHLIPLGRELKLLGWQGRVGWFLHTPFPPSEVFAVLPWAAPLLEALSYYDLVGLHTKRYIRNLYDSLAAELPRGILLGDALEFQGRLMRMNAYPVGIEPGNFEDTSDPEESPVVELLNDLPHDHTVVLGVDRLDYTKGIPARLMAFEQYLDDHPEMHGKITLVQVAVPSREFVPGYEEERNRVDQLVGRINGRFSELHWAPIRYLYRSYGQRDLAAFYHRARVCLVTPLADGMNLVAKEYVAAQDASDPGVLVLSKFCGAAETMTDAVIVNPYDTEATAAALHQAVVASWEDRMSMWQRLMQGVNRFTASQWSRDFISDLTSRA